MVLHIPVPVGSKQTEECKCFQVLICRNYVYALIFFCAWALTASFPLDMVSIAPEYALFASPLLHLGQATPVI